MSVPAFICAPQRGARITVPSCQRMFAEAKSTASAPAGSVAAMKNSACRGCAVGAAHARGELPGAWPDGRALERVHLVVHQAGSAPPPPASARVRTPIDTSFTAPKSREHEVHVEAALQRAASRVEVSNDEVGTMEDQQLTHPDSKVTDTIKGWAARLDMTDAAIRARLKKTSDLRIVLAPRQQAKPGEAKPRGARATSLLAAPEDLPLPRRAKASRPKPSATKPARSAPILPPPPPTAAQAVREQLAAVDPIELLRRLGFRVDDQGVSPSGARVFSLPPQEA